MRFFRKKETPKETVRRSVLNKLRNTTDQELIRWVDNIHSGVGRDVMEMRRSLSHSDAEQAYIYIEDIRHGAVSLLAAMQVLEERFMPQR